MVSYADFRKLITINPQMMQIVGSNCHTCQGKIAMAREGHGCPQCQITWHTSCVEGATHCPKCQRDSVESLAAQTEKTNAALAGQAALGQFVYWLILAFFLVLVGLEMAGVTLAFRDPETIPPDLSVTVSFGLVLRVVVFFGAWFLAYQGRYQARLGLGVIAVLWMVGIGLTYEIFNLGSLLYLVLAALIVWASFLSSQVLAFENSQAGKLSK
jgi:hypothetical protein